MKGWQQGVARTSRAARHEGQVSPLWDGRPRPSFRLRMLKILEACDGAQSKSKATGEDARFTFDCRGERPTANQRPTVNEFEFQRGSNPKLQTSNSKPGFTASVLSSFGKE